ncbi:hypothetical protein F4818DRAFT_386629 [Hypoxylon cercidicola]|nr:hypothetical protein F4818DRAFT_386629 [Hypoxylon cercidicola]
MSSGTIGQQYNNEERALNILLERIKDVQTAELSMLSMDVDEALLALNAASWKLEDFTFFAGYLSARTAHPCVEVPCVEQIVLAADVVQGCKLLDGTKIRSGPAVPPMVIFYAISCLSIAIGNGIDLKNYLLNEYSNPALTSIDSTHFNVDKMPDNVDKTADSADKGQEFRAPSRYSSSDNSRASSVPAQPSQSSCSLPSLRTPPEPLLLLQDRTFWPRRNRRNRGEISNHQHP